MSILAWPSERCFGPKAFTWGASTPKSGYGSFFSGQTQSVSHLADRLRATVTLAPCSPLEGARREAFFMEVISAGHWLSVHHLERPNPNGTLRGTPTVAVTAAAGARTLQVQGEVGDTLLAGDPLGADGGLLLLTGYAGAVADGAGVLTVPLVLPLRQQLTAGAGLTWLQPVAHFQIPANQSAFQYGRAAWQAALDLTLVEVY